MRKSFVAVNFNWLSFFPPICVTVHAFQGLCISFLRLKMRLMMILALKLPVSNQEFAYVAFSSCSRAAYND